MKIYRVEHVRNEKSECNVKGDIVIVFIKGRDLFNLVTLEQFFRARFKKSTQKFVKIHTSGPSQSIFIYFRRFFGIGTLTGAAELSKGKLLKCRSWICV